MRRILLTFAIVIATQLSYAQFNTSSGNTTTTDKVGIGTTSPGAKLTVYQTQSQGNVWSANTAFNIVSQFGNDANGTVGVLAKNGVANYSGLWLNNSFDIYSYNNYGGWFRVMNNDATRSVPSISVLPDGNGNVGIGTTSPYSLLTVGVGNPLSTPVITTINTGNTNKSALQLSNWTGVAGTYGPRITFDNSGHGTWYAGGSDNTNNFDITQAWGTPYLRIGASGNVGIGTSNPYSLLTVGNGGDFSSSTIATINTANANKNALRLSNWTGLTGTYGPRIAFDNSGQGTWYVGGSDNSNNFDITRAWGTTDLRIDATGNVAIGTTDTHGYKLAVNGDAIATSLTVKLYANWPDYVFKKEYKLPSLTEVKNYIDKNQHLPEMPSEAQVAKSGINLGEIVKIQTKKIEELTLYAIQQKEENQELKEEQKKISDKQEARIAALEATLAKLTANK